MIFALLLLYFTILIWSFMTFDKLVICQYERHNESWVADGEPYGIFWRHPRWRSLRSWKAFQRSSFCGLYRTHEWMKDDDEALRLVKRLRWLAGIKAAVIVIILITST